MIRARGLTRRFSARGRTVDAVRGVDIEVEAGELVGFLGPNGAGKTTTLRMLTTLLRPTSGEATVGGRDLLKDPLGVRKRIGYVAQGGGTAPECKVTEELELQGRLYGLIHDPKLIFLDEPSTGLDPQSRANLWEHIRRLHAEHGVTVFLTTHYLDEADALCDRILVIDNGEIVAEGSPDSLKARVSGDGVKIGVPAESVSAAAAIAAKLTGAHELTTVENAVQFRVPRGDTAMPELLRALDAAGIAMQSMQVTRPTLDDVFLTMTGRSLRDAEQATPAAEETSHVA